MVVNENVLVFDIETAAFGPKPNPEKDEFRIFGAYSYRYDKFYFEKDLKKVQAIIDAHKFMVGHNSSDKLSAYDVPILERHGISFKHKTQLDTMTIMVKRHLTMQVPLKKKSLKYLAEIFKLDVRKGDLDYNILKKPAHMWSDEEEKEIIAYLKNDVEITKQVFEKVYNYYEVFKQFISQKDKERLVWISSSIANLGYLSMCYQLGLDPEYSNETRFEDIGGLVRDPTDEVFKDLWYIDVASLYPSIIIMFNMFSNPTITPEETNWFEGNSVFEIKGKYGLSKYNVMSEEYKTMFIQRKPLKKTNPKLSYAYKILMNAGYGVLRSPIFKTTFYEHTGADVCRIGQKINLLMTEFFDKAGFETVYGDSVGEESKISIMFDNKFERISFNNLWSKLLLTNKVEIKNNKEYIFIDNIKTPSMNKKLEIQWMPIKYVMRHKNNKKCYEIYQNSQNSLIVTEDHSLIDIKHTSYEMVEQKPMNIKSVVLNHGYFGKNKRKKINHFAEMLGYWVGNGCLDNRKYGVYFGCGPDREEIIDKCFSKVFNNVLYRKGDKGDVSISEMNMRKKIFEYTNGEKANNKNLSKMFNEDNDFKFSLLRGLFSSDGTVLKNGVIRYSSISKKLVYDMKLMLEEFGITSTIIKDKNKCDYNGKISNNYSYYLKLSSLCMGFFRDNIGFIQDRKQDRIKISKRKYVKSHAHSKEIVYDKYVYDIEVENTHNFFANDILVHNTDSIFIRDLKGRSKEDQRKAVKEYIAYLVSYVKENVPFPFEGFDIDIETGDMIDYLQFFWDKDTRKYKKKNYVMIHSDGKGGKEVEIKGLSIKKDNASRLGMHIYEKFLEKRILENQDCKFEKKEIELHIKEELEKDITLASVAFNVNPAESYKSLNQIQAQISRAYLDGESGRIHLVKNYRFGKVGKGDKYCLLEEANQLRFEDLILDKVWNELEPFIKEEKPIDLMSFDESEDDDLFEEKEEDDFDTFTFEGNMEVTIKKPKGLDEW